MSADPWRVTVTDEDVAAARQAWMDARDHDAPPERVDLLWSGLERLWRAQAKQLVEEIQRRTRA